MFGIWIKKAILICINGMKFQHMKYFIIIRKPQYKMEKLLFFSFFFFQIWVSKGQLPFITPTHEYFLEFNENFNGTAVDFNEWMYPENGSFHSRVQGGENCSNRDQQYFSTTGDNLSVSNSICSIIAKREYLGFKRSIDYLPDNYMIGSCENLMEFFFTSAELWTKTSFGYGIYEARIKVDQGSGYGGSFWMFSDEGYEIDVQEYNGNEPWVLHTDQHCFMPGGADPCFNPHPYEVSGYLSSSLSDDYHIYTLIWTPQQIEWLIDGVPFRVNAISFPEAHMHIILTVGVGGNSNEGYPSFYNTNFPLQMDVDYVRFWRIGRKFPDCTLSTEQPDKVFNVSQDISGSNEKHFKNSISTESGKSIVIKSNANIWWTAGNYIELNPGFETEDNVNAVFEILDCDELFGRLSNPDTTHTFTKTDSALQVTASRQPLPKSLPEVNNQPFEKTKSEPDSSQSEIISITPNPSADGKFNVNCLVQGVGCMNAEISVLNMVGQVIHQKEFMRYTFPVSIDLSAQPKGTYFIKIRNAEKVFVQKVVSQ